MAHTDFTASQRWALIFTNMVKLTGLIFAIREFVTTRDAVVMVICVVMMSGAQSLESSVLSFFEKFLGGEQPKPKEDG